MNPSRLFLFSVTLSLALTASLKADPAAYASVLKQRDDVLSRIVSHHEQRLRAGSGSEEEVLAARLTLYTFRRDTARTTREKIQEQEQVVALHEKRLSNTKSNLTLESIEVLRVTDGWLEAKQMLESLRSSEPKA
jgi:hypothetical protein